jgi:hypothetical protein
MMSRLLNLPGDVENLIYRNVHEMNMLEVTLQLKEEVWRMNTIICYIKKRSFYPYRIRFKIFKEYYFKETSFYCRNKVYRYIHHKLLSRCLQPIYLINHLL